MSFSKAKLHRFNDIQNYTPSPADYNVSQKGHVSGAIIPKSDRFAELRSPASSDNGSFVSTGAGSSTFRTPNPPRRIKTQTNGNRKPKPVELFQPATDLEALNDKIVECDNKDQFIQELTDQIDDLKQRLCELETQLAELNKNKLQLEDALVKLKDVHKASLEELRAKHLGELVDLNAIIGDLNDKVVKMKSEYKKLREDNKQDLADVLKDIERLNDLHETLTTTYNTYIAHKTEELENKAQLILKLEEDCSGLKIKHSKDLDELTKKHRVEIQDIEFEMLKTVTEVQKQIEKEKHICEKFLKEAQAQFDEEKLKLVNDFEATVKQREEFYKEANLLAEIQMKEKCNEIERSWELKLEQAKEETDAILKECQAIAEYNVIQSEVEKNKALYELSELKNDIKQVEMEKNTFKADRDKLQNDCKELQTELSNIIIELNSVREISAQEIKNCQESAEHALKDRHLYEVTVSKTHTTIEALKRRLMNSDRDVEQLKAELEATEMSKLEVEGKCNQLMDELHILTDLCDHVEEQNELALKVAEQKINKLESELLEKVDYFKQESETQINNITDELNKTKKELSNAMEHLHEQQEMNINAQDLISASQKEIEHLESLSSKYTLKISYLEAAFDNVQETLTDNNRKITLLNEENVALADENKKLKTVIELMQTSEDNMVNQLEALKEQAFKSEISNYEKKIEDAAAVHKKYTDLNEEHNLIVQKLQHLENENELLRKKVAEQEALIGPFREHLEAYEMEYSALMNQKRNAEQEAREMGMKYAQILGHQNQKQKIKHMMDLKKKNYDLAENNKELEIKIRAQSRSIDKLKKELSSAKSPKKAFLQQNDDKENINSPNRSLNTSRIDSPSGPLRNRN